jgi:hypothetical protein
VPEVDVEDVEEVEEHPGPAIVPGAPETSSELSMTPYPKP